MAEKEKDIFRDTWVRFVGKQYKYLHPCLMINSEKLNYLLSKPILMAQCLYWSKLQIRGVWLQPKTLVKFELAGFTHVTQA